MGSKFVKRHKINIEEYSERLVAEKKDSHEMFSESSEMGDFTASYCANSLLTICACNIVTSGDLDEAIEVGQQCGQLKAALFRAANSPKKNALVKIADYKITVQLDTDEDADYSMINCEDWLATFFINLAFGKKAIISELLQYPLKMYLTKAVPATKFEIALIKFIHAVWNNQADRDATVEECARIIDKLKPGPSWDRMIGGAWFAVVLAILTQDDETDGIVQDAIQLHKEYYSSNSDRKHDPAGFISIPLLGAIRWAKTRKIDIEVESDYLPLEIVRMVSALPY